MGGLEFAGWRGVLRRLNRAFQSFYRRVREGQKPGFPRFRAHRRYRTIELAEVGPAMLKRSEDGRKAYVVVKGLPTITLRLKRPMPEGTPQNLMITRRLTGLVVSPDVRRRGRAVARERRVSGDRRRSAKAADVVGWFAGVEACS